MGSWIASLIYMKSYLKPTSSVPVATKSKKLQYNIGVQEGLANVGNERNELVCLNKDIFKSELKSLLDCHEEIDALVF